MTSFDKLTSAQKTRAALHRDVRAISSETCHFLGIEMTTSAMDVIAELVYKKLSVYGTDLEAFAKHAKRATITSEDVKLLARRNPSLLAHLNSIVPTAPTAAPKRRKTGAKPQETPAKNDAEISKKEQTNTIVPRSEHEKDLFIDKDESNVEHMILDSTIDLTFD